MALYIFGKPPPLKAKGGGFHIFLLEKNKRKKQKLIGTDTGTGDGNNSILSLPLPISGKNNPTYKPIIQS